MLPELFKMIVAVFQPEKESLIE